MFDKLIREIENLPMNRPGGVKVSIDMPLDDKGYFDRKCPHRDCRSDFKVLFVDWKDKVPDATAVCPKCGEKAEPEGFNTRWQNDYIEEAAHAYAQNQIDQALGRAARATRPQRISAGPIDVTMSVSFKAGPRRIALPPAADEALRQDFECEPCGCRYSTVGAGYFCPACGHNSADKDFDQTVETVKKSLAAMAEIRAAVTEKHDEDVAANVEQQILEDQVENLVTAFQRITEALFASLPNASSFNWDQNLFQRMNDASNLWQQATGSQYQSILETAELELLATMIQRRHKLGHSQGMVDQRYIDRTGDTSYAEGQRLVVTASHVESLADVVTKLVKGLRSVVVAALAS